MKGKTTALALTLSLALLLPLSACGGGGLSADDAKLYVQGILDENYLGKSEADFRKLIDITEEDVEETYAGSLETEAQFFLDSFVESELPEEDQDRLLEEHAIFVGTADQADSLQEGAVVARESSGFGGVRCLVKRDLVPAGWELERPTVEDVVLFLVKGAKKQ